MVIDLQSLSLCGHLSYFAWFISIELELLLDSSQPGNAQRALAALPCDKEGEILQEASFASSCVHSANHGAGTWWLPIKFFSENENGHLSPGLKVNSLPRLGNQEAPQNSCPRIKSMCRARLCEINKRFINEWMNK